MTQDQPTPAELALLRSIETEALYQVWYRSVGMRQLLCEVDDSQAMPFYSAWVPARLPLGEAAELATDICEQALGKGRGTRTYHWWFADESRDDSLYIEREYPDPDAE